MTCWITLGRDNANVVTNLVSNEYNVNAKTQVKMKLVQGGILEATFAGKGPDIALFMGGDFPIQLASRDVLVDISQFSDFEEVTKRFSPDATTLYKYNDGVYGLPISQDFPMLFYRSDIQGICDSLQMSEADTIINMYRHAVVWNLERQIFGDEINVHLNDSTADWATLPTGGFMAEHLGENCYDQLSGKKMKAWFENKELRRLDVDGNVQVIMFPQEKDSTYNKMVNAESSYLRLNLKAKQEVDRITMWPEVSGQVIPLFLAKKSDMFLPQFKWYDELRPKSPADIYDVSDDLKSLMQSIEGGPRRRSGSNANVEAAVVSDQVNTVETAPKTPIEP